MQRSELIIAAVQFSGVLEWEQNLETSRRLLRQAARHGAELAVLPEAANRKLPRGAPDIPAQPLDGPFVSGLAALSAEMDMTIITGTIEARTDGLPYNTLVALQDGEIPAVYRKVHMYDAFGARESDRFTPGDGPITHVNFHGFSVGMLTCYDLRFPEMSRLLALGGADVLVARRRG